MKIAPMSTAAGMRRRWSDPTSERAMWGIMRPTKPMVPTADTIHPTSRADTTRYTQRLRAVFKPSVVAASSPMSKMLSERNCVRKKSVPANTTPNTSHTLSQPARVSDPIVQNLRSSMPCASAATVMMKLDKAVKRAFSIMPDKTSLLVVILPPAEAKSSTPTVATIDPKNEKSETEPTPSIRAIDPAPHMMASVAPKLAPEEMPRI